MGYEIWDRYERAQIDDFDDQDAALDYLRELVRAIVGAAPRQTQADAGTRPPVDLGAQNSARGSLGNAASQSSNPLKAPPTRWLTGKVRQPPPWLGVPRRCAVQRADGARTDVLLVVSLAHIRQDDLICWCAILQIAFAVLAQARGR